MKDLKEMFDALLDGETLIHHDGQEIKKDNDDKIIGIIDFTMIIPFKWHIKQKPKWYKNINGRSVLCKAWDDDNGIKINKIIEKYDKNDHYPFIDDQGFSCEHATPLSSKEIQTLLDNAIDIEKDVF